MTDDTSRSHLRLVRTDTPPTETNRLVDPGKVADPAPGTHLRMFDLTGRVALVVGCGGLGVGGSGDCVASDGGSVGVGNVVGVAGIAVGVEPWATWGGVNMPVQFNTT
jgi:hypothetical protein